MANGQRVGPAMANGQEIKAGNGKQKGNTDLDDHHDNPRYLCSWQVCHSRTWGKGKVKYRSNSHGSHAVAVAMSSTNSGFGRAGATDTLQLTVEGELDVKPAAVVIP